MQGISENVSDVEEQSNDDDIIDKTQQNYEAKNSEVQDLIILNKAWARSLQAQIFTMSEFFVSSSSLLPAASVYTETGWKHLFLYTDIFYENKLFALFKNVMIHLLSKNIHILLFYQFFDYLGFSNGQGR